MPQKGQINISLPRELVERIKKLRDPPPGSKNKYTPTGYIRDCLEHEVARDEELLEMLKSHKQNRRREFNDILKLLEEKGEKEIVERLKDNLGLNEPNPFESL